MQMKSTSFPESWPRVSHGVSLAILLIFLTILPFSHFGSSRNGMGHGAGRSVAVARPLSLFPLLISFG